MNYRVYIACLEKILQLKQKKTTKKVENWKKGKEETFKKVGQMNVVTVMGMRCGSKMNYLKQK